MRKFLYFRISTISIMKLILISLIIKLHHLTFQYSSPNSIPSGIQGPEHPHPGQMYYAVGFPRVCYLPDNELSLKVLRLLQVAFERRLIFTIGRSVTTGREDVVTWNGIHHKTELGPSCTGYGYPDVTYLERTLAELASHGVTDGQSTSALYQELH